MIELEFTIEEVNLILHGLQELPAKYSFQLLLKIQAEAQKQIDEQQKTVD